MKRVNVSVIIPTYNSAAFVTEAIDSVLAQTIAPAEIIVVDDGSTDDTAQRLAAYQSKIRYVYQDNAGVSAARNRGIEGANGDFIAFLDADDVWHPQKLELQMDAFAQVPAAGLVGTRGFYLPTTDLASYDHVPASGFSFVTWRQLVVKNHVCSSSVVVRSSILNIAGPFDSSLQGPEDHDLWLRIAEISTIINLNLPLTGYRIVPGSVSQQPQRCQQGMERILLKLDQRRAWKGRWLLRQKSKSYIQHSCAYLHGAAGNQRDALLRSLRSVFTYPFPYRSSEVDTFMERPKRLAMIILRLMKLKGLDPHTIALKRRLETTAAEKVSDDFQNRHAHPSA